MRQIPDHPEIRAVERCGYPPHQKPPAACPLCAGDLGERAYELEGEYVCRDCFTGWVQDYLRTNPEDVARALFVQTRYLE